MHGEYLIKIGKEVRRYTEYDDIPMEFDHLIKFKPDYPEPPHSMEEHEWIEQFGSKMDSLLSRERK